MAIPSRGSGPEGVYYEGRLLKFGALTQCQSSQIGFPGSAKRLEKDLGAKDRARLDQDVNSVRDLETRLPESAEWKRRPKPLVRVPEPKDAERGQLVTATRLMFDLVRLTLADSTRLVTIFVNSLRLATDIPGVEHEIHSLSARLDSSPRKGLEPCLTDAWQKWQKWLPLFELMRPVDPPGGSSLIEPTRHPLLVTSKARFKTVLLIVAQRKSSVFDS
jgi:hypothetical protein